MHQKKMIECGQKKVLAICGSAKPAPGRNTKSAAREILLDVIRPINSLASLIEVIDVRDMNLHLFDGRTPQELGSKDISLLVDSIEAASGIIFSVPAYWGSVGAAFKNFIEVTCGPNYSGSDRTPFGGKKCVSLLIASNRETAISAPQHLSAILNSIGVLDSNNKLIVIADPRNAEVTAERISDFRLEVTQLVMAALKDR